MKTSHNRALRLLALVPVVLLGGCLVDFFEIVQAGSTQLRDHVPWVRFIKPSAITIEVGETVTFNVAITNRDNLDRQTFVFSRRFDFTSTAPGVAAVLPSPRDLPITFDHPSASHFISMQVIGVSPGVATIVANGDANIPLGISPGRAQVTVASRLVVEINPLSATRRVGESLVYGCTVRDAGTGAVLPNVPVDWFSFNPSVASIDQNGFAAALDVGTTTIRCQIRGRQTGANAVLNVISSNLPPTAVITAPPNGAVFGEGETVTFFGNGTDPEDGALTGASLAWSLGIIEFGTGTVTSRTFPAGTHTIVLTATDRFGAIGTAQVTITVVNRAPTAVITVPQNGAIFFAGELVTFLGNGTDPEDGALGGASLVWRFAGTSFGNGNSASRAFPVGIHTIVLTATDSRGAVGTAQVTITVIPLQMPSLSELGGGYRLNGTKRTDTCPAGQFPATLSNPGPIAFLIGSPNQLTIQSTAAVTGVYNLTNGMWTGTGQTTIPSPPSILRETISGTFRPGPPAITLTGTIQNEIFFVSGTKICDVLYDVTYTKTN